MLPKFKQEYSLIMTYECPSCEIYLNSTDSVVEHAQMHGKPNTCFVCQTDFPNASRLKLHVHSKHVGYQCSECEAYFRTRWHYNAHMEVHEKKKSESFMCNICQKLLTSMNGLRLHISSIHEKKKRYTSVCPYKKCGLWFASKANMNRHYDQVHSKLKQYVCQLCGKAFTYSERLKVHHRTHTNERPYVCTVCGTRFMEVQGLRTHEARHKPGMPFECPQCHRTFKLKQSLKAHLQTHSDLKIYDCGICFKRFTTFINLHQHERNHVKPHICQGCGQRYPNRSYLIMHQEKKGCLAEQASKITTSNYPINRDHLGNKLVDSDAVRNSEVDLRNKLVKQCVVNSENGIPRVSLLRLAKKWGQVKEMPVEVF